MQLHELKSPKGSRKRKKLVGRGRGSGHGGTSCRGENGQGSRSSNRMTVSPSEGGQMRLIRRLPKVGFRSHRPVNQVVNLDQLNRFEVGAVVNAETLKEMGLVKSLNKPFKILGKGAIDRSLVIQTKSISKSAQEKIVKAGGKIEEVKVEKAQEKIK